MARLHTFLILFLAVILALTEAELRTRRSPQYSQATALARSFGGYRGPRFDRPDFGPPRPHFGPYSPRFGPQQPAFVPYPRHGYQRPFSGGSINIAKSISISSGGGGGAQASSQSRSFGK